MTAEEQALMNYFKGEVSPTQSDSILSSFTITAKHLVMLCRDCISQKIRLQDLEATAILLSASKHFIWDTNTEDGKKVESAISNWLATENGPLTIQYLQYCAYYLETGEHR